MAEETALAALTEPPQQAAAAAPPLFESCRSLPAPCPARV